MDILTFFGCFYLVGVVVFCIMLNVIFSRKYGFRWDAFCDSFKYSLVSWVGVVMIITGRCVIEDKKDKFTIY